MKNTISNCLIVIMAFSTLFIIQCTSESGITGVNNTFPEFYKEGHRGTAGFMPENTIPAMKKGVDLGANVVEMDVQISKDGQVMVSHDPTLNPNITTLDDNDIPDRESELFILHQMNYKDIRQYDVGSKYYSVYPTQKKMPAYIPLLGELIDSVEQYTSQNKLPKVIYNIEIKADPDKDGIYQPTPDVLIKKVMDVVNTKDIDNRYYLQSFDIRQIQEVHKKYPDVVIGFLTGDKKATFEENIEKMGFLPEIYSPNYKLATQELIDKCHQKKIKFVPWTVDKPEDIKRLKAMGVDGIITNYPNLLKDI